MTCHRCDGDRFVETEPDSGLWKPCPACNQDTHGRWAAGDYQPPPWTRTPTPEDHTNYDPATVHRWFNDLRNWLKGDRRDER